MITLREITLMRGSKTLLHDTSLQIFAGQHVGIVGRNGCGKSSLFALLRGELQLDQGLAEVPRDWRIASVKQETPALDQAALDYVLDGDTELRALQRALQQAEANHEGEQIGRLHDQLAAIGAYDAEARAATLLAGLGFQPEQIKQPVKAFSGGWRMRLNLAQALIARADLLLLDEPTNHLDVDAIFWLEDWLQRFPGTLLIISHDRDFLDASVGHILHIEHQRGQLYKGNYSSFERQRAEQLAQQQAQFEKEQTQRAHLQRYIDRFRYKASKAKQAQSRLKALEKLTAAAPIAAASGVSFEFPEPAALPNPLLRLEQAQAGYDDHIVLDNIQLNLVPGSRIGLLGRNGAGKSTLVKLLAGELKPRQGSIALSQGVQLGYFAQHQLETLDASASALLHLQRIDPQASEQKLRDHLGGFGFHGEQALTSVAPMSGGEKARLVLALIVYQKPNLLLLDEPTNHLDSSLREALVYALQDFQGAMVIVSHDRHLLRTTVDEFYLVANGTVQPFSGDLDAYHDWLQQQSRQANVAASETAVGKVDRKAERRAAAELRAQLRPLQQQLKRAEQQLEQVDTALQQLNEQLADTRLYQPEYKAELAPLLQQQAELKQAHEQAELSWFAAAEALEQATAEQST